MLTVADFLNLEPFKDFTLVSGFKGLTNKISSANIMDNPDALDWFSPEEMLLSSGYFFKDNKTLQDGILRQLKMINCPALILKPTSYLGTIPDNMLSLSNEMNLPIIEMPYGISFSKVMARVTEELSEDYNALNRKSLDIHNEFFQLTLHGGSLQKISDILSRMLDSSIFLCDTNWSVLNSTVISSDNKQLHMDDSDNLFFSQNILKQLPPKFEDIQKPIIRLVKLKDIEIPCIVTPVVFNKIHYGYIVVLQFNQSLKDHHYIALENGSMAFALEQTHSAEIKRTHNRIQENFFDELLAGKLTSLSSLKNLANLHGIDLNLLYTSLVFKLSFQHSKLDNIIKNIHYEENTIKKIMDFIKHSSSNKNLKLFIFNRKNQIILLIGSSSEESLKHIKRKIESIIDKIESNYPSCSIYCGIGNTSKQLLNIKTSFYEAQETLRLMENEPVENKVYHYNDFFISHFFKKNIPYEELVSFFSRTLGPLYEYDQNNHSNLIETLICLVSNQLNIAKTARQLYIHRNSLLYRIEKIEGILVSDFKDSEELLKLQIAIKIYYILGQNNQL